MGSSTRDAVAEFGVIEPELAEAVRAVGFEDERGDGRAGSNGVAAAAGVLRE